MIWNVNTYLWLVKHYAVESVKGHDSDNGITNNDNDDNNDNNNYTTTNGNDNDMYTQLDALESSV